MQKLSPTEDLMRLAHCSPMSLPAPLQGAGRSPEQAAGVPRVQDSKTQLTLAHHAGQRAEVTGADF